MYKNQKGKIKVLKNSNHETKVIIKFDFLKEDSVLAVLFLNKVYS